MFRQTNHNQCANNAENNRSTNSFESKGDDAMPSLDQNKIDN